MRLCAFCFLLAGVYNPRAALHCRPVRVPFACKMEPNVERRLRTVYRQLCSSQDGPSHKVCSCIVRPPGRFRPDVHGQGFTVPSVRRREPRANPLQALDIKYSVEVQQALVESRAIVALESTIISHGAIEPSF